jgi:hypothetical protein
MNMITYVSKTGYVKRASTGECYEAKTIYCPDGADLSVYSDISQADYETYRKAKEEEMEKMMKEHNT